MELSTQIIIALVCILAAYGIVFLRRLRADRERYRRSKEPKQAVPPELRRLVK